MSETESCLVRKSDIEPFTKPLKKIIKQLQAELDKHRWIPVEERLPKIGEQIIVMWKLARLRQKPTVLIVHDTWLMLLPAALPKNSTARKSFIDANGIL